MTESEWATCDDPERMLQWLQETGRASERKLRLFACACCLRIWNRLRAVSRTAIELVEQYANGHAPRRSLSYFFQYANAHGLSIAAHAAVFEDAEIAARRTAIMAAREAASDTAFYAQTAAEKLERAAQAALIRCIFGNPFRPVTIAASWRTPAFVSLAQQVYNSRDFARLPELAEALVAEGCEEAELLGHLRSGPHARGCFVLDLLLGRD